MAKQAARVKGEVAPIEAAAKPAPEQIWRDLHPTGRGRNRRTIRIDRVKRDGSLEATVLTTVDGKVSAPRVTKMTLATLHRGYELIKAPPGVSCTPEPASIPVLETNRIVIVLDDLAPQEWLQSNKDPKLRDLRLTEAQLVSEACRLVPSYTPTRLAREGIQLMAQRLIATARSSSDKLQEGRGIIGSRDADMAKAVDHCREQGIPITPYYVKKHTVPPLKNILTAERFLVRTGLWKRVQKPRTTKPAAAGPAPASRDPQINATNSTYATDTAPESSPAAIAPINEPST